MRGCEHLRMLFDLHRTVRTYLVSRKREEEVLLHRHISRRKKKRRKKDSPRQKGGGGQPLGLWRRGAGQHLYSRGYLQNRGPPSEQSLWLLPVPKLPSNHHLFPRSLWISWRAVDRTPTPSPDSRAQAFSGRNCWVLAPPSSRFVAQHRRRAFVIFTDQAVSHAGLHMNNNMGGGNQGPSQYQPSRIVMRFFVVVVLFLADKKGEICGTVSQVNLWPCVFVFSSCVVVSQTRLP